MCDIPSSARLAPVALAALIALAAGCGESPPPAIDDAGGIDAGQPDARVPPSRCERDEDCDDGVFCNGAELCEPEAALGDDGCVAGVRPCAAGSTCDESGDQCSSVCTTDADGDGYRPPECGGADCDDGDADRHPGNTEVCDAADHDEDCDPTTYGFRDADGDGAPDAACCNVRDDGTAACGDDCDDMRPGVNPDNPDICNGRDDDCDGATDEEVTIVLYEDADGDGYGSAAPGAATMTGCGPVVGWRVEPVDCDDDDNGRHPGAIEQCDGVDDDCDERVDERMGGCGCELGSMQPCSTDVGTCTAGTQSCTATGVWGACSGIEASVETCNGADDDCDGTVDEGAGITCYGDADGDGYAPTSATPFTACRDPNPARAIAPFLGCPMGSTGTAPSVAPPTPTADCNDASAAVGTGALCYRDADGDGHGAQGSAALSTTCGACPAGQSLTRTDCCDTDATTGPGADFASTVDACGSFDRDCNGTIEQAEGLGGGTCFRDPDTMECSSDGGGYTSTVPACGESASAFLGCGSTCRPIIRLVVQSCR